MLQNAAAAILLRERGALVHRLQALSNDEASKVLHQSRQLANHLRVANKVRATLRLKERSIRKLIQEQQEEVMLIQVDLMYDKIDSANDNDLMACLQSILCTKNLKFSCFALTRSCPANLSSKASVPHQTLWFQAWTAC